MVVWLLEMAFRVLLFRFSSHHHTVFFHIMEWHRYFLRLLSKPLKNLVETLNLSYSYMGRSYFNVVFELRISNFIWWIQWWLEIFIILWITFGSNTLRSCLSEGKTKMLTIQWNEYIKQKYKKTQTATKNKKAYWKLFEKMICA